MSVQTRDGAVYADFLGYAVSRMVSFWEIVGAIVTEAFELRARMMKQHNDLDA